MTAQNAILHNSTPPTLQQNQTKDFPNKIQGFFKDLGTFQGFSRPWIWNKKFRGNPVIRLLEIAW